MRHYKVAEVVEEISERVNDPANSKYDKFVGLEHYVSGDVVIKQYGSTENLESSMKAFRAGDILIARRNVYLRRASVVLFDGVTSGDSIVLRARNPILAKLLPFVFNTDGFWDFADKYSDGTMSKRLSPKTLMKYEFDLPNEEEQEKLANILWSLNDTREAYRLLLIQTDEMVKSQFIEMFSGVKVQSRLDELCAFFGDGDWIESKDQSPSGIRLIQTGNVGNGEYKEKGERARYISEETFQRLNCTEIKEGDVLISRLPDPIGRACILPAIPKSITAVDCTIVRFKEHILPSYFVAMTKTPLYTAQIDAFTTGSTRKRVSRANLGSILVPVPEMSLQMEFVAIAQQSDKSKFNVQIAIYRDVQGM